MLRFVESARVAHRASGVAPPPGGAAIARLRVGTAGLVAVMAGAWAMAGPIPPGRQHRLTIEGENTVTFLPRSGLAPVKVDYKAKIEYIINTRYGKEARPGADEDPAEGPAPGKKAVARKGGTASRAKAKEAGALAARVTGALDLALHSSEMGFRQDGRPVVETRTTRSRFQGRLQPDSPALDVSERDAPPRLQEVLKGYDVVAASLLLDDDFRVVGRRSKVEGPQRAMIETLLSIHTPIPRGADSWESPTQLAMGHGQAARGKLRFEKVKAVDGKSADLVKVKVSGVLKAEGVVAGQFIKEGSYTVAGEQVYDSHSHEWVSSRWSVAVVNELANQAGVAVAQAKGSMTVESRFAEGTGPPASEGAVPRL